MNVLTMAQQINKFSILVPASRTTVSQRMIALKGQYVGMTEYQIKRGFKTGLSERMIDGLEKYFEATAREDGSHYSISYGSFSRLEVYTGDNEKTLICESESDMGIFDRMPEEEANAMVLDTNKRFRQYLEYVTGYNTKERKKNAEKAAKKSN